MAAIAIVTHQTIDVVLRTLNEYEGSNTMLGRMGQKYEPFKVLISTILSARAKDEVTEVVSEELFKKYPDALSLSKAKPADVKKIIRRIGFFNAKTQNIMDAAKMVLTDFKGKVPDTMEQLLLLPGVGRKVANCVLVYSFGKDAIPVDTHVHRIANRLGWIRTKTPEESEQRLLKLVPRKHWQILNDTFVTHGKTICAPISPKCSECPIHEHCKRVSVTVSR